MVKNLYLILVVVSRVTGLYLCVSACFGIVTSSLLGSVGHMNMKIQAPFTFALILSFILGAVLLFLAKPLARAFTSDLD